MGDDAPPKPSRDRSGPRSDLPDSGLVAMLFTDIEGSTRLVSALGDDQWAGLLAEHRALVVEALGREQPAGARWGVVGSEGDSLFVAFASPLGAVRGAASAQLALAAHPWPSGAEIRVRMGIHAGEIVRVGDDYVGYEVHKAARVMSAAHGGQVVLSRTLRALLPDAALAPLELRSLGVHHLKDVPEKEELFQLAGKGLIADFPPLRTLDALPNNLPVQLTRFVGREAEIGAVKRQLLGTRLLTLTGTGGTGKTRLSLRVAEEIAHDYRDGAWFVPLAAVTDPALVPSAIVASLGIAEVPGTSAIDRLREVLADRRQLIVLDNFEQVQGAAPAVGAILRAAPGVAIIATSRGPLRVDGERELPVPPLGLPDLAHLPAADALLRSEAVALFVDRAQAARPDFALTDRNAAAVAGICARLDGLPLADRAGRRADPGPRPEAILARLEKRLDLLVAAADGIARSASRPCGRRSPGATTCSIRDGSACSPASACLPGAGSSSRRRRSAARSRSSESTCSTGSTGWSTRAWSGATRDRTASHASSCWRRSASSPSRGRSHPVRPTSSSGAMRASSWTSPKGRPRS